MNISVGLLGHPAGPWGCGYPFIENVYPPNVSSGWGDIDKSNQNWVVTLRVIYRDVVFAWVSNFPACPDYMNWSPESPCIAAHRVCDEFLCMMCYELDRIRSISCNTIVSPWFNFHGDDQEVPVNQ